MKDALTVSTQVDVSQTVTISQKDWQRIILEIFKQEREVESLKSLLEVEKKETDLYRRHYEISEERRRLDQAAVRASEQARILAWFEAQGFMPMMLLTGRAIANRLRKALPVS